MAAIASEVAPSQWRCLEPEGRGHELLITWGIHRRGGERTHSPISAQKYDPPMDPVHDDEPYSVVLVDDVLRTLVRTGHEHTVEIAKRFYLEHPKYDFFEVAGRVSRTEGFVRLTLRGVCELVENRVPE